MNSESDRLRLRDPNVLANRFAADGARPSSGESLRLPPIRFERAPHGIDLRRSLRCITPAHVLALALVLALLALAERFAHPLHVVS